MSGALPESPALDLDLADGWLTVWFNEPEARNALTTERAEGLMALAEALQDRRDVRGVIFRGRGGVFCAGGDLKAFNRVFQGGASRDEVVALSRDAGALFDAVDGLPQLTVMAVEGAAIAGGFGLACCGDVVIAEAGARFGLSETRIGLTPAQIAPFVLRRLGPRLGRRLMLTGAMLDAAAAAEAGLVDEAAEGPDGMEAALARWRATLRPAAPGAVASTKALIRALPKLDRLGQIDAAAESFADAMLSEEGREGVASFVEKRKPNWAGS